MDNFNNLKKQSFKEFKTGGFMVKPRGGPNPFKALGEQLNM